MASQSSAMYAQNMANLLGHLHGKEKAAGLLSNWFQQLAMGDQGEIVARSIVCCKGCNEVPMPPPPQPTPPKPKTVAAPKAKVEPNPFKEGLTSAIVLTICILLMLGLGEGVPSSLLATFLLAGAAGYQAVWGVAHALHTPLMSVTNAISGMSAVGGLILMNKHSYSTGSFILAAIAVAVSAVNIFGGFLVSQRMLDLFKKPGDKDFSPFMLLPGLIFAAVSFTAKSKTDPLLDATSVISALLCVAAIGGLASQSTANAGCKFGILGMFGALISQFVQLSG